MQIVAANAASGVTKMQIAPDDWRRIPAIAFFCNATVRSRSRPHGGTSLASPACCRRARLRRDPPCVPLAGSGGIQHRRRGVRPLGGSRARQAGHCRGRRRWPGARRQLRLAARYLEQARQRARGQRHRARRPGRDPVAAGAGGCGDPHRDLQARRHCAAARHAVRHRGDLLPAAEFGREGADHQRAGARQGRARRIAGLAIDPVDRRAGRWRARPPPDAGARLRRSYAAQNLGRRSGHDDLHVRHHRPAQGRAACPSRAARPYAGDRDAARFLPAAGRPVLDAGRLGLGRRPARLLAAEPLLRRAGGGAPLRQVRSRRSLCRDGAPRRAQRVHPADRAAHDALGRRSARPLRPQAAHGRLRRRGAGRADLRMGQVGARCCDQRVLRPDRMQSGAVVRRHDRRVAAGRDRQAGAGPSGRGDPPGRHVGAGR